MCDQWLSLLISIVSIKKHVLVRPVVRNSSMHHYSDFATQQYMMWHAIVYLVHVIFVVRLQDIQLLSYCNEQHYFT